jgi:transcriptional regulator with XRE-family HTH domain
MDTLTKKEKLLYILEKVKLTGYSAHYISKNAGLSEAGVQRILNGTSKSPQKKSLDAIIDLFNLDKNDSKKELEYINIPKIHEFQQEIISLYREAKNLRIEITRLERLLEKNNITY